MKGVVYYELKPNQTDTAITNSN